MITDLLLLGAGALLGAWIGGRWVSESRRLDDIIADLDDRAGRAIPERDSTPGDGGRSESEADGA